MHKLHNRSVYKHYSALIYMQYKIIRTLCRNIEEELNKQYKKGYVFVCFIGFYGKQSILSNKQQILFKKR